MFGFGRENGSRCSCNELFEDYEDLDEEAAEVEETEEIDEIAETEEVGEIAETEEVEKIEDKDEE